MIGYSILAFAIIHDEDYWFYFTLVGSLIIGMACSFGESVMLGYLNSFPHELVNHWSSGTGMAGIGGTGLILGLFAIDTPLWLIFSLLIPLQLIYFLCFHWL